MLTRHLGPRPCDAAYFASTALVLAGLAFAPPLQAQDAVRAHLMGDPLPGHNAPAFSLPYATADGPGPADQPFVLRAELGRVVVLAFGASVADAAAKRLLTAFTARYDSLFPGDVVVVVVTPDPLALQAEGAREVGLRFKLLADTSGAVRRMFGVREGGLGVYVVGLDGTIVWRDTRFNAYESTGYAAIRRAVVAGWKTP